MPKINQSIIDAAQATQLKWGIPASVVLAQFALESGWGKHDLGANNYFGIKYGKLVQSQGFVTLKTREVIRGKSVYVMARFAKFDSPTDCFIEHGRFLAEHPHLSRAMKHKDDPFKFIAALQEGSVKYATDPEYVSKLTKIIKSANLTQYDIGAPPQPAVPSPPVVAAPSASSVEAIRSLSDVLFAQFDKEDIYSWDWVDVAQSAYAHFLRSTYTCAQTEGSGKFKVEDFELPPERKYKAVPEEDVAQTRKALSESLRVYYGERIDFDLIGELADHMVKFSLSNRYPSPSTIIPSEKP